MRFINFLGRGTLFMCTLKKYLILIWSFSFLLFFSNCTKYKEPVPFFDGLFLEYAGNGRPYLIYEVSVIEGNKFKILRTDRLYKTERGKVELYVDNYGKVYKSSKKRYKGKFSPIWIPVHEMDIGDKFDGRNLVIRRDRWVKWNVLVVKDLPTGAEVYYEINTGFYVGESTRGTKIILSNTNADIPTIEE